MTDLQKKQILNMRKNGDGYKAIASALGLTRDTVRNFCKKNDMTGYGKVSAMNTDEKISGGKICANCCKPIEQSNKGRQKRFCSEKCRREWWKLHPEKINKKDTALYHLKCVYCGRDFVSYGNKNRKYCCHNCYIHDRFWKKEESIE
ncbi:MAG: helix-turn-helix domain-containing protein [Clostridia bacterium]|nr:helix-turn-helix domain-containing protein [Clostridia bacterium]